MIQLTAQQAKDKADKASITTKDNLLNVIMNKINVEAAKNLYMVEFILPKHHANLVATELEKLNYKLKIIPYIYPSSAGTSLPIEDESKSTLVIDFSNPTEPAK